MMIHSSALHSAGSPKEQEYLAGWQRARAELDNFRRRVEQEQGLRRRAIEREVIESWLTLADNFQALVRHVPADKEADAWVQGVLHVARQLEQLLAQHGVTQINPQGQAFDPKRHEAVEQGEGEKSGLVMEVLQPGYAMGEVVLRPAKVKVTT